MSRTNALLACLILGLPLAAQTATQKAEARLTALLAPTEGRSAPVLSGPVDWKPSRAVAEVAIALPRYDGVPLPLPAPPHKPIKPHAVPEETPLVSSLEQPAPPKNVELPTKPLLRVPSIDVNAPLPIPILAQPLKDRASLADPTLDASLEAALQPLPPVRRNPVPFTPMNLPDPFENVRTGQLRNPPEENPMPPVIPIQTPGK